MLGVFKCHFFVQASLGEAKTKGNESVPLHLKFGDQKLVLGTLSLEKFPQLSFDLVFEKEFELSHNWKQGSVYFCGYRADSPDEYPSHFPLLFSKGFFYNSRIGKKSYQLNCCFISRLFSFALFSNRFSVCCAQHG